jgi:hypothetical protein
MPPVALPPRAILDCLVSFPTVSRDSNLTLVDWVADYLGGFGIASQRVYNADRTKASLYAHAGPWVEGGVVIPMWSRWPGRRGHRTPGRSRNATGGFMVAALAT